MDSPKPAFWTRDSSILLGGFFVTVLLIMYVWWPLAKEYLAYIDWHGKWWLFMDWLLLGNFLFMSLTIVARANLKTDVLIVFVGVCGGLAIESWGTQTNLWHYYTSERPPLWIIPAWPIASLSIDRITRFLDFLTTKDAKEHKGGNDFSSDEASGKQEKAFVTLVPFVFKLLYWLTFISFMALMLVFVSPTFDKSYTWLATILCILLILTPTDYRYAFLTFVAGTGLGYFLELWGTTRGCWIYYTNQTPPFFAVVAHGMAAVAFWRAGLVVKLLLAKFGVPRVQPAQTPEEA